jgi:hypothetical protein
MLKNEENITAEKTFVIKTANYLYLGPIKEANCRTSCRRSLQPSEKNIQHFKT